MSFIRRLQSFRRLGGGTGHLDLSGLTSSIAPLNPVVFCSVSIHGRCFSTDDATQNERRHTQSGPSSSHRAYRGHQSAREQFESQRTAYHKHSFHEKGSKTSNSAGGAESNTEEDSGKSTSFTGKERRTMTAKWENAFFGRVHFEEGMHQRYAEAVAAEEVEQKEDSAAGSDGWFPHWTDDTEAPRHLFHALPARQKLDFIIDRLTKGERRIKFAPDYGSLTMMAQLNLGELMIRDAENLLNEMDWMTPALQEKIDAVKDLSGRIKYDYDID